MSIEDKISKLLNVTARLSKLLKQENELLAANGSGRGIKPLLEEKIALSSAYEQQLKIIQDDNSLINVEAGLQRYRA